MNKVRIKVLRTMFNEDLAKEYGVESYISVCFCFSTRSKQDYLLF